MLISSRWTMMAWVKIFLKIKLYYHYCWWNDYFLRPVNTSQWMSIFHWHLWNLTLSQIAEVSRFAVASLKEIFFLMHGMIWCHNIILVSYLSDVTISFLPVVKALNSYLQLWNVSQLSLHALPSNQLVIIYTVTLQAQSTHPVSHL